MKTKIAKAYCIGLDDKMTPDLRKAVYATETFQRFLFARKRVEHIAEALFVNGGRFNDKALLGAARELNALAAELQAVIERRKRGLGQPGGNQRGPLI